MANERMSARPLSELDKATRERLERLMGTDPKAVTAGDKAFLQARKDYLTAEQRKDYGIKGKVNLDDVEEADEETTEDAEDTEETEEGDEEEAEDEEAEEEAPAPKPKRKAAAKKKGGKK